MNKNDSTSNNRILTTAWLAMWCVVFVLPRHSVYAQVELKFSDEIRTAIQWEATALPPVQAAMSVETNSHTDSHPSGGKHEIAYRLKPEDFHPHVQPAALEAIQRQAHLADSHLHDVEFPGDRSLIDEPTPPWAKFIEWGPHLVSVPHPFLARVFERVTCWEHDHIETELHDHAIGIQPIAERPPLILEWNEQFLSPGFLNPGLETRTGAVWRPSLWVFGQYRTTLSYFDRDRAVDPIVETAKRLDLFAQLNLSGTERVVVGLRPLDEEEGAVRDFTGYDFHDGDQRDGWNADFQTLFFEGEFGEIFPWLDPHDVRPLDWGFSIGRQPLLAQQGLLINEDALDAFTISRNTLNGRGNLNLRLTGVFSWRGINRNSSGDFGNEFDPGSKLYAILSESDFANCTVNVDGIYVDGDEQFGDLFAVGVSSIQRHHLYDNTYNSSLHLLASFPGGETTDFAEQGELLFAQTSWTPHHTHDIVYANAFWAIDQFTSPARGTLNGNALGQTGILFSAAGLGRYGAPISAQTSDSAGASFGYQMFFDHTRSQVIWEWGGVSETQGSKRGTLGTALRLQKAFGQHTIFLIDAFVAKQESQNTGQGLRTELLFKF